MAKQKSKSAILTSPVTPPPVADANSMSTLCPAGLGAAFWNLKAAICELLCNAEPPHKEPLTVDFWHEVRDKIKETANTALRSAEHLQDEMVNDQIKQAKRLGVRLATLLCDNPILSTVRIQDWTVTRFRKIFDDLSELESKFERLAMRHAEFTDNAGRRIIRGMVEPDKESGFVEANNNVPAHWMPVIRWIQKQYSTRNDCFPEARLWRLFPEVDGFQSLMEYLESLGAITSKGHGIFLIELGENLGFYDDVNDLRDIKPAILASLNIPLTRTIIPAEPATAFWYLERFLADLLFWSIIPHSQPLTNEWLDAMRDTIRQKCGGAMRSVEHYGPDAVLDQKIRDAQSLALQLATLLHASPDLSTIPRRQWTVPRECQLYDELANLQREFRELSKPVGGELISAKGGGNAIASKKPHPEDQKRLEFYDARKAENSQLTHKKIAILWCKEGKDYCDENAFRQSVWRARDAGGRNGT